MCLELNEWIMTNELADGCINLDNLRSEEDPAVMRKGYTDDGIHFTEEAQVDVVDSISMSFFGYRDDRIAKLRDTIFKRQEADAAETPAAEQTDTPAAAPSESGADNPVAPAPGGYAVPDTQSANSVNGAAQTQSAFAVQPGVTSGATSGDTGADNAQETDAVQEPGTQAQGDLLYVSKSGLGSSVAGMCALAAVSFVLICALLIIVVVVIPKKKEQKLRKN